MLLHSILIFAPITCSIKLRQRQISSTSRKSSLSVIPMRQRTVLNRIQIPHWLLHPSSSRSCPKTGTFPFLPGALSSVVPIHLPLSHFATIAIFLFLEFPPSNSLPFVDSLSPPSFPSPAPPYPGRADPESLQTERTRNECVQPSQSNQWWEGEMAGEAVNTRGASTRNGSLWRSRGRRERAG